MKLKRLELSKLEIPFRTSFRHSSYERSVTETVLALAESDSSLTGYGEGCPRSYVTGESVESCMNFLKEYREHILRIDNLESLSGWVLNNTSAIDKNPAAWCAIETALLDLLGKCAQKSLEGVVGIPEIAGSFKYSAVLGAATAKIFDSQLNEYVKLALTDFKVKVCGDYETDRRNIDALYGALPSARVRIDANNLWQSVEQAKQYILSLGSKFWAVEEPLKHKDFPSLKRLARDLDCKIILDESFLRIEHLAHIENDPAIWVPNISISKMGGLLRALSIAKHCKESGIKIIIGAQVGETSILTRVALALANIYRDSLLAQEGAFGTYLLTRDITTKPLMFGKYGELRASCAAANGLGIECVL